MTGRQVRQPGAGRKAISNKVHVSTSTRGSNGDLHKLAVTFKAGLRGTSQNAGTSDDLSCEVRFMPQPPMVATLITI